MSPMKREKPFTENGADERSIIKYFRFHSDYSWNTALREPPLKDLLSRALGSNYRFKKDRALRFNKYPIFNSQFPYKSGLTLRYNPASGISAALRPAKLIRVREL